MSITVQEQLMNSTMCVLHVHNKVPPHPTRDNTYYVNSGITLANVLTYVMLNYSTSALPCTVGP